MNHYRQHLIAPETTVRDVLSTLNDLAPNAIAFVVDDEDRLLGSVTDGDIRRGLISGKHLEDQIIDFVQANPYALQKQEMTPENYKALTEKRIKIVPIVDEDKKILGIIDLKNYASLLPVEAVIMAGGKGTRLRPLTENTPKPLLPVGDKPIMEHLIDRLISFGIKRIHISVNYLGDQIKDYFGDGSQKQIEIDYIDEDEFLGTAGSLILGDPDYQSEHLLFMNSDLLTNIDFADMYDEYVQGEGDMIVASVPYEVQVPYGVIETSNGQISGLKEKPTYTYYSNAGIYLINKNMLSHIPRNELYNATDLIEDLMQQNFKVLNFPIRSYWLDIGKPIDYEKAQQDIKHIKL